MKIFSPLFLIKTFFSLLVFFQFFFSCYAQTFEVKGTIKDATNGEALIGANVLIGVGKGTITDIEGNYSMMLEPGEYTLNVTYIGYQNQSVKIKVKSQKLVVDFTLESIVLNEVEIVADVAKNRETPVAFVNISATKIAEELNSRDIPMVLNSTPGVYATEQGGGSGDARVTIRGFNQRNIGVMIDGIPVNDMENGWVYWSNWDGLGDVTKTLQVQRGLGSSKLAISSVGGTMNLITKGIESKPSFSIKQEVGNNQFFKTSLAVTTGRINNKFGVTMAVSKKSGLGWVDQTWTNSFSYFVKKDLNAGKHLLGLAAVGSPQEHGQRVNKLPIGVFNKKMAADQGIDTSVTNKQIERGLTFNQNWGELDRYKVVNGDTIHEKEKLSEKENYFHKPQFYLKDFWKISDKLYFSNILYLSVGKGGGTGSTPTPSYDTPNGQANWDILYSGNQNQFSIKKQYDSTLHKSSSIIRASVNNHFWYGLISSFNYDFNNNLSWSGGVDLRDYKGEHYREVYDLLGGDYFVDYTDFNSAGPLEYNKHMKKKGDKITYYYDGLVRWGGGFTQLEYKKSRWSTFFNGSYSKTGYKKIDYFNKKDIVLSDTTIHNAIGIYDTVIFRGNTYTTNSDEVTMESSWKLYSGFTIKGGVNYNITEHQNIFFNTGYLSKAPPFNNVYDRNSLRLVLGTKNEIVRAIEVGYGLKYKVFAANINTYYTIWDNKPLDFPISKTVNGERYTYNINGMKAEHTGYELDFIYKFYKKWEWEGLISLGDWKWNSKKTYDVFDENEKYITSGSFSAVGVHVGDAAQIQYASSIRYEPFKGFYLKPRYTFFGKNYSTFDPVSITGKNENRDSWRIPDYGLLDFFSGYNFKIKKIQMGLSFSIINVLDTKYISDAQNNDSFTQSYNDFDAKSASVYFGQGRRYNLSLRLLY